MSQVDCNYLPTQVVPQVRQAPSRRWHLAAALRRRCRAQSTHEANQLDGGQVDHVDGALETTRQPAPRSSVSKARLQVLQMREHAPRITFRPWPHHDVCPHATARCDLAGSPRECEPPSHSGGVARRIHH